MRGKHCFHLFVLPLTGEGREGERERRREEEKEGGKGGRKEQTSGNTKIKHFSRSKITLLLHKYYLYDVEIG